MTYEEGKQLVEGYTAERYAAELPLSLLRALADAPIIPEHELGNTPARYGGSGKGRKNGKRHKQ